MSVSIDGARSITCSMCVSLDDYENAPRSSSSPPADDADMPLLADVRDPIEDRDGFLDMLLPSPALLLYLSSKKCACVRARFRAHAHARTSARAHIQRARSCVATCVVALHDIL